MDERARPERIHTPMEGLALRPSQPSTQPIVVFHLDDRRFGIRLEAVERIVRMVEIMPLPRAPRVVAGAIDVAGTVIAVLDVRHRFGLPPKPPALTDHLLIAHTTSRNVALVVDAVSGVHIADEQAMVPAAEVAPCIDCVDGVVRLEGGLTVLHDLDAFLSVSEEGRLDGVLTGGKS